MAKLTTEQINSLWDNRLESKKYECDGVFDCYAFHSKLDGCNYYLHYHHSDGIISDTDTITEIESVVKADLANVDYIQPIIHTETNI